MPMKAYLGRLRALARPIPQWAAVAMDRRSQPTTATLRGRGIEEDVSHDHTVASLNPLVIATSVDAGDGAVLTYADKATATVLGRLRLIRMVDISDSAPITFYRVVSGQHYCLGWFRRRWEDWRQRRTLERNRKSARMNLDAKAAQYLMIVYLSPRPVALVSVRENDHRNMFPMDLIGQLSRSGLFSLALRSTNVSAPHMKEGSRLALSYVPGSMRAQAYEVSAHHKEALTDWTALPFAVRPSPDAGMPVVADALAIRELTIVHRRTIGLHMFFLCREEAEESHPGAQLHHTAGFYEVHRRRKGLPLRAA